MIFKFAHFADIHLGAFRDPILRELNVQAFEKAIDRCVGCCVDFIIIAGDLFEIALPYMAVVDRAVRKMKELKDLGIPIYVVYGSHDYSATEISIIDILGSAGLLKKVVSADVTDTGKIRLSFFTDKKTGARLAGMSARKRGVERTYYENLDCAHLEENENNNFKLFLFHSTLNEMKPEFLSMSDGIPLSNFPKNFNYYAGGHVHKRMERDFPEYGKFVFPGHLFGRDYRDLENVSTEPGGFYFVEVDSSSKIGMRFEPMDLCSILSLHYNAGEKTSYVAAEELKKMIDRMEAFSDKKPSIVLFKVYGELSGGKPSDINFGELKNMLLKKGASAVYFNHNSLSSRELEQLKIKGADRRDIEEKIFEESLGLFEKKAQLKNVALSKSEGCALSASLLSILKAENTGESKSDYEIKIKRSAFSALVIGESQ
ncbi:DNA double-strand break repair protein Mre11 [uncultured archaeon]|nr:DNA double-strand break repair protein Mre11 [uncultured archaeon]